MELTISRSANMPNQTDLARIAFKYFNYYLVFLWRIGLGKWLSIWPEGFGKYMVITHRGRKSGKQYRTPVNYADVHGEIYCAAGFGRNSDWYRNVLTNPHVELWIPDGWYVGSAEEVAIQPDNLPILRAILINSGFVAKLVGIDPHTFSDEMLLDMCKDYRLIHIRRTAPRTGAEGPGDLAWIWPILLTFIILWKPTRKK
jgi:deazaflavin-dependent oxidoreductase (nitroreductase family)